MQENRLRTGAPWTALVFALVLIGVVWVVYGEMTTSRPLATFESHAPQYERLVDLVRSDFPMRATRVGIRDLSPEAEQIARGLGVVTVEADNRGTVILRPMRGFDRRIAHLGKYARAKDYNGVWRDLEGRWFYVFYE